MLPGPQKAQKAQKAQGHGIPGPQKAQKAQPHGMLPGPQKAQTAQKAPPGQFLYGQQRPFPRNIRTQP